MKSGWLTQKPLCPLYYLDLRQFSSCLETTAAATSIGKFPFQATSTTRWSRAVVVSRHAIAPAQWNWERLRDKRLKDP